MTPVGFGICNPIDTRKFPELTIIKIKKFMTRLESDKIAAERRGDKSDSVFVGEFGLGRKEHFGMADRLFGL